MAGEYPPVGHWDLDLHFQMDSEGRLKYAPWRPIETAPKVEDQELIVCSYEEGGLYFCDVVTWVSWADEGRGGWFNGDVSHSVGYFTHWMPRPAPPAA